jgi:ribosome-binding factor A
MKNTQDNRRVSRFEKEILQITAKFLQQNSRLSFKSLLTVVKVMMPADLRTAKVYISVYGGDEDPQEIIARLNDNAVLVQHQISKEMSARYCPKVTFFLDETTEKILKVEKTLQELSEGQIKSHEVDEN